MTTAHTNPRVGAHKMQNVVQNSPHKMQNVDTQDAECCAKLELVRHTQSCVVTLLRQVDCANVKVKRLSFGCLVVHGLRVRI
jgi:hypothetical protein